MNEQTPVPVGATVEFNQSPGVPRVGKIAFRNGYAGQYAISFAGIYVFRYDCEFSVLKW